MCDTARDLNVRETSAVNSTNIWSARERRHSVRSEESLLVYSFV